MPMTNRAVVLYDHLGTPLLTRQDDTVDANTPSPIVSGVDYLGLNRRLRVEQPTLFPLIASGTGAVYTTPVDPYYGIPIRTCPIFGTRGSHNEVISALASNFTGSSLDPLIWSSTTATGGTLSVTAGEAAINTTGTNASASRVQSVKVFPYIVGAYASFRFVGHATSAANNRKRWGLVDSVTSIQNGYYFELNGTTARYCYAKAGVVTTTDFVAAFPPDDGFIHLYEILFLGTQQALFYMDGSLVGFYSADLTGTLLTTTLLFATMDSLNTGTSSATAMTMTYAGGTILDAPIAHPKSARITSNSTTQLKRNSGKLISVIVGVAGNSSNRAQIFDDPAASPTTTAILNVDTSSRGTVDCGGLVFASGLVVTLTGGTAGDVTVVYT